MINHAFRIFQSLLVIALGGVFIGLFHEHDGMVALALAISGVWFLRNTYLKNPTQAQAFVLISGMFISAAFGTIVEYWGIQNGYWAYHDLSGNPPFPLWLPIAWSLAFIGLYRVESHFVQHLKITSMHKKLTLACAFSIFLPTWGEVIAINMGVWSYTWDYEL